MQTSHYLINKLDTSTLSPSLAACAGTNLPSSPAIEKPVNNFESRHLRCTNSNNAPGCNFFFALEGAPQGGLPVGVRDATCIFRKLIQAPFQPMSEASNLRTLSTRMKRPPAATLLSPPRLFLRPMTLLQSIFPASLESPPGRANCASAGQPRTKIFAILRRSSLAVLIAGGPCNWSRTCGSLSIGTAGNT